MYYNRNMCSKYIWYCYSEQRPGDRSVFKASLVRSGETSVGLAIEATGRQPNRSQPAYVSRNAVPIAVWLQYTRIAGEEGNRQGFRQPFFRGYMRMHLLYEIVDWYLARGREA